MCHGEWAVDTRKAAEELSFVADFSFEKTLAETLAWYGKMNWLPRLPRPPADGGSI